MLKVTVGHQSWCQEQFLFQDRWETKSFPQSLSYRKAGYASLLGPLKHLSPNQSSVCGDDQELTSLSSLQSKIGLGWNSWVNTDTPGWNWTACDAHKIKRAKSGGGTRPSALQPTAPNANITCFSNCLSGQEKRTQSRGGSAPAAVLLPLPTTASNFLTRNGRTAAGSGHCRVLHLVENPLSSPVLSQPQNAARNQPRAAAASPINVDGGRPGPGGTQDSSRHQEVQLHIQCCFGNDTDLEPSKPQPWRISIVEQEVRVML